ncbi:hypothetical protein IWX49DRAFT_552035 [Phyllosticta citricarpa]
MDDVILARTDKTEIRCLVASDGTAAAATEAIERKGYRLLFCVGIGRGGGSRTVGVDDLRWDYAELSGGRIPILVLLWPLGRDDDYFFQHLPACQADGAPNLSRASTSPRPSIVSQRVFENLLHSSHSCSFVHSKWSDSSLPRESCLGHLVSVSCQLPLSSLLTSTELRAHVSQAQAFVDAKIAPASEPNPFQNRAQVETFFRAVVGSSNYHPVFDCSDKPKDQT